MYVDDLDVAIEQTAHPTPEVCTARAFRPCDCDAGAAARRVQCDRARFAEQYGVAAAHIMLAETIVSNLLKSNCPVTGQPDWASVSVRYEGPQIDHASFLRYVVSFRQHTDFHEVAT